MKNSRLDLLITAGLAFVGCWAYWPTFVALVERWENVPDYSHGFLVIPIAVLLLYLRRSSMPELATDGRHWGIGLVCLGLILRIVSARAFLPSLDGWSIPVWVAGIVLWFGGWRLLRWASPAIIFLIFMVPLPYRVEHMLTAPLQNIAATSSVYLLHCLGQPAVREGVNIILSGEEFSVAKECSGLRMLMGVLAMGFAYVTITRIPWWQKLILAFVAVPLAVVANVLRVTMTALLVERTNSPAVAEFVHDAGGWLTFAIGGALFLLVTWCLEKSFVEVEQEADNPLLHMKSV